jgi:hypothetical protein
LGLSRESSWRSSVESFTLRDHVLCNWIQWISSQSSWTVRFGVRACRNDDPCCGCWLPQCPKVHNFIPSGHTKIGFNHCRGSVRKSQFPMRRLPFPYGRRVHSSMLVQDPPPGLPFSRGSCWLDQSSTCPSMMSKWLPKRMGRIPEQPVAQTHLCLPLHRSHPKATRPRHILTTWIQRENTHPICPAQSKPTNEDSRKPSLNVRRLRVAAQKHVQKSTVFPNLMDNNGAQTTSVARGEDSYARENRPSVHPTIQIHVPYVPEAAAEKPGSGPTCAMALERLSIPLLLPTVRNTHALCISRWYLISRAIVP